MLEHTPTPWMATNGTPNFIGKTAKHPMDAILIAKMVDLRIPGVKLSEEQQRANADFIVRACNNYEALLAACKATLAVLMEPGIQDVDEWKADVKKAVAAAIAAIAEAEGDSNSTPRLPQRGSPGAGS